MNLIPSSHQNQKRYELIKESYTSFLSHHILYRYKFFHHSHNFLKNLQTYWYQDFHKINQNQYRSCSGSVSPQVFNFYPTYLINYIHHMNRLLMPLQILDLQMFLNQIQTRSLVDLLFHVLGN